MKLLTLPLYFSISVKDSCTYVPFLAGCGSTKNHTLDDPSNGGYLTTLVDSFIFIAAIVAVAFLLVGGIKYITSGGDPARTVSAKNTIQYALIGLIVAILARALIGFIIGRV